MGIDAVQSRIASLQLMLAQWNEPAHVNSTSGGAGGMLGASMQGARTDDSSASFDTALSDALGGQMGGDDSNPLAATAAQRGGSLTGLAGLGGLGGLGGAGGSLATLARLPSAPGSVGAMLRLALAQSGKPYVWGASASPTDPNPKAFDCSELVQWVSQREQVGGVPRTAAEQWDYCRQQGTTMSVDEALRTPGALLFRVGAGSTNHVAISLGDGRTIEARGKDYGVGVFSAAGRTWTGAGRLPGIRY